MQPEQLPLLPVSRRPAIQQGFETDCTRGRLPSLSRTRAHTTKHQHTKHTLRWVFIANRWKALELAKRLVMISLAKWFTILIRNWAIVVSRLPPWLSPYIIALSDCTSVYPPAICVVLWGLSHSTVMSAAVRAATLLGMSDVGPAACRTQELPRLIKAPTPPAVRGKYGYVYFGAPYCIWHLALAAVWYLWNLEQHLAYDSRFRACSVVAQSQLHRERDTARGCVAENGKRAGRLKCSATAKVLCVRLWAWLALK